MMSQVRSRYQHVLTGVATGLIVSSGLLGFTPEAQARKLGSPSGNSSTGAVRGACPALAATMKNRKLVALIDQSDPVLTTQAKPTFWFYLPFTQTEDINTVEFELVDEDQKPVLQNKKLVLQLPEKPGLVQLTLPTTEKPLAVGKEYFWIFRVMCDENDRSANPTVTGWIERVNPSATLVSRLKATPNPEQFKLYAENNLWLDRVRLLVQHRAKYQQDWAALLNTFGLTEFAQSPITELRSQPQPTPSR